MLGTVSEIPCLSVYFTSELNTFVSHCVTGEYAAPTVQAFSAPVRKVLFEEVQKLTLADVKAFQEKWVKDRTYTYCILGNEKDIDMSQLSSYGPVQRVTTEEIFGY